MGEESLKMTYETLFELTRREKQRGELQELESSFFDDVKGYVAAKKAIIDEQSHKQDLESTTRKSRIIQQLDNIKNLLRELYERRERKIVNMAINRVKVSSTLAGENNLLPPEQEYYDALIKSFARFREKIYLDLLNATSSNDAYRTSTENQDSETQSAQGSSHEARQQDKESENSTAQQLDNPSIQSSDSNSNKEMISQDKSSVLILKEVSKFYDEDLSPYGPYKANDRAQLPRKLADVLVKKGAAEIISS